MTRAEAIGLLSGLMFKGKLKEALDMAIASLETDEAYQLEYERTTKNDLGVDCISRKQALEPYKILENTDTVSVYTIRQNLADLPSMGRYDPYTDKFIKE